MKTDVTHLEAMKELQKLEEKYEKLESIYLDQLNWKKNYPYCDAELRQDLVNEMKKRMEHFQTVRFGICLAIEKLFGVTTLQDVNLDEI